MNGEVCAFDVHSVTKSNPSPGISILQYPPDGPEKISDNYNNNNALSVDDAINTSSSSRGYSSTNLRDIHMSGCLIEDFLNAATDNTAKDLETCGVLGAFLKDETFYITTLIIPKQEATSSSCQAKNEEEIYAIQNEDSQIPIGWIHTHPSQSCFMSSIDLHTHFTYQVMVPEAIAIVVSPTDKERKYGIFRLSDPYGMNIIKNCEERGFHLHPETADSQSPVYEDCSSNIIFSPNLRLEIRDLR